MIGTALPGSIPDYVVSSGLISKISTGAPVPEGSDAVVKVRLFIYSKTLLIISQGRRHSLVRKG